MILVRHVLPTIVLLVVSALALAGPHERVVPEAVLNDWGYETSGFKYAHSIKAIDPIPGSSPRFYPRFHLRKTCFPAQAGAASHKSTIEAEIAANEAVRFKDSREVIVAGVCAYEVAAQGTYNFLEHQPSFMRRMEEFLCSESECFLSSRRPEARKAAATPPDVEQLVERLTNWDLDVALATHVSEFDNREDRETLILMLEDIETRLGNDVDVEGCKAFGDGRYQCILHGVESAIIRFSVVGEGAELQFGNWDVTFQ